MELCNAFDPRDHSDCHYKLQLIYLIHFMYFFFTNFNGVSDTFDILDQGIFS